MDLSTGNKLLGVVYGKVATFTGKLSLLVSHRELF